MKPLARATPTAGAPAAGNGGSSDVPSASGGPISDPARPPSRTGAAGMSGSSTPNTALTRDPISIDDCGATHSAGLSADDLQKLKQGSGSPGMLRYLYPYDGTVFPRGMLAPDLMWDGSQADAIFVHIKSMIFEYSGCLKPTEPGRITLSQDVWDKAGQRSLGKTDGYLIELTTLAQGVATGPVRIHIQIAQAAVKGSIYYNTYSSNMSGQAAIGAPSGMVLRIPAGGKAEVFGQTDCNGCHSVSADGSTLVAQLSGGGALSYKVTDNAAAPAPAMLNAPGSWVALYPDGSAALSMSSVIDVARAGIFGGISGGADATLYDTKTGDKLASTGIPAGVLMPFFSPDGTYLAFNDYAIDQAHGIALMHYDTKTHTASDYTELYRESDATMRPAWPFVLPDDHAVVFIRTDDGDFTGGGVGVSNLGVAATAPFAELSVIDVASKSVTLLANAMGYKTPDDAKNNTTYLPFGDEDLHHAYYPTISPVGAGGYFWVFFDSYRHYGGRGLLRQLWGAAIDISPDGTYTRDPSHPAFYVTGQEFGTGNHRAFTALDPCKKDGDMCSSGIDCCGGFCEITNAQDEFATPVGTCAPKRMMTCSKRDERCVSSSDCCAPSGNDLPDTCIAGFCTLVRGPD